MESALVFLESQENGSELISFEARIWDLRFVLGQMGVTILSTNGYNVYINIYDVDTIYR